MRKAGTEEVRASEEEEQEDVSGDRRRVTEVLDLLAMWALLQVFFVWCFARAAGLMAHDEFEQYRYEGEIQPVHTAPQPECTASPYIRSNPHSTTKDNLENLDPC